MTNIRRAAELAIAALEGDEDLKPEAILALEQVLESTGRLRQIVYRSKSLMSLEGLFELLEQCRANNLSLGITGVLLHWKDQIVQVLEGPDDALRYLIETIKHDRRHKDFCLLTSRVIADRNFADWLMASAELQPDEFAVTVAGFEGCDDLTLRKVASWAALSSSAAKSHLKS